jgi:hypothetical protein
MASDERVEVVVEGLLVGLDEPRNVGRQRQVRERDPAGKDHVDQHEDPLLRSEDEDVALRVIGSRIIQAEAVVAGLDGQRVVEDPRRRRTVGVGQGDEPLSGHAVRVVRHVVRADRHSYDVVGGWWL